MILLCVMCLGVKQISIVVIQLESYRHVYRPSPEASGKMPFTKHARWIREQFSSLCACWTAKSLVWHQQPGATHLNHLFFLPASGRQRWRFVASGKFCNVCFNGRNAEDLQDVLAASSFSAQVWRWESPLNESRRHPPAWLVKCLYVLLMSSSLEVFSASGPWQGAVTVSPAAE